MNGERLEVLGLADQDCSTERDEVPGYLKVFKAGPSVLGPCYTEIFERAARLPATTSAWMVEAIIVR